ncbi:MAG: hypothetical protein ABIJ59_03555 [Pseudomonadota bacterium]
MTEIQKNYSKNNSVVDSTGTLHSLLKQDIMDRFGYIGRPDYNGESEKYLQGESGEMNIRETVDQTD